MFELLFYWITGDQNVDMTLSTESLDTFRFIYDTIYANVQYLFYLFENLNTICGCFKKEDMDSLNGAWSNLSAIAIEELLDQDRCNILINSVNAFLDVLNNFDAVVQTVLSVQIAIQSNLAEVKAAVNDIIFVMSYQVIRGELDVLKQILENPAVNLPLLKDQLTFVFATVERDSENKATLKTVVSGPHEPNACLVDGRDLL
jgi:hypothetical protein